MASNGAESLLWMKGSDSLTLDEDAWDDTELIKLYDKSVAQLKKHSNISLSSNCQGSEQEQIQKKKKKKKQKSSRNGWKVGQECLAIYHGDGLYYEATILSINHKSSVAKIRFSSYGNEEDVSMKDILGIECKSEMEYYDPSIDSQWEHQVPTHSNDTINNVEYDNTDTSDVEIEIESSKATKNWQVSDLCYVVGKKGGYHRAVVNSIKSSDCCIVTIVKTNQKKEVKISQLLSSLPAEKKRPRSSKSSSPTDILPNLPFPNMALPLPPLPPPHFLPSTGFSSHTNRHLFSHTGNLESSFPPYPQPPVIPDDLTSGNEEALANMLMSWYMSGFYTGYYQGLNQKKCIKDNMFTSNVNKNSRKKKKRHQHDKPKVSKV